MSLNRNDIKVELYRLFDVGMITDEQANKIFEKSYENQQIDNDIMSGVDDTAVEWIQQKIIELGF